MRGGGEVSGGNLANAHHTMKLCLQYSFGELDA